MHECFETSNLINMLLVFVAQKPALGQGLLIHKVLDHTQRRITVGRVHLDE
jgi:hypothetical protein